MMGMGQVGERLGNPAFNMASIVIADAISEERLREETFFGPFLETSLAHY
jgi:hypothetical protein